MSDPHPVKLNYAGEKPLPWHRRNYRNIRRVVIGLMIAIAGVTLCGAGEKPWQAWKEYRQYQLLEQACNQYSPPPTRVVVDDDPADFKSLLASDPLYLLSGDNIAYVPPVWFHPEGDGPPPVENMAGVLYLGAGKPNPAPIIWSYASIWLPTSGPRRSARQDRTSASLGPHDPFEHLHHPHEKPAPENFRRAIRPQRLVAWFIAYTLGNTSGIIDGRLQDDESVNLQLRDGPTTLP